MASKISIIPHKTPLPQKKRFCKKPKMETLEKIKTQYAEIFALVELYKELGLFDKSKDYNLDDEEEFRTNAESNEFMTRGRRFYWDETFTRAIQNGDIVEHSIIWLELYPPNHEPIKGTILRNAYKKLKYENLEYKFKDQLIKFKEIDQKVEFNTPINLQNKIFNKKRIPIWKYVP